MKNKKISKYEVLSISVFVLTLGLVIYGYIIQSVYPSIISLGISLAMLGYVSAKREQARNDYIDAIANLTIENRELIQKLIEALSKPAKNGKRTK